MMGTPGLFTRHPILRAPGASDLGGWTQINSDAETMRFIGGTGSRAATWRRLCTMRGA